MSTERDLRRNSPEIRPRTRSRSRSYSRPRSHDYHNQRNNDEVSHVSLLIRNIATGVRPAEIRELICKLIILYFIYYIFNLSIYIILCNICTIIAEFGEVRDVYMPLDYSTGRPRGFAFTEFLRESDAQYN